MTDDRMTLEEVARIVRTAKTALSDAYPGDDHTTRFRDLDRLGVLALVVSEEPDWEYVPGWISADGRARISAGVIAPGYVAQFIAEGGEVVRRRVSPFETVTADTAPAVQQEGDTHA